MPKLTELLNLTKLATKKFNSDYPLKLDITKSYFLSGGTGTYKTTQALLLMRK